MLLLEDQHGAEADSVLAAGSNVDANGTHGADESGRVLGVEGDEGALVLATKVGNVVRVLGGQTLKLSIEESTDASGLLDELVVEDLLNDSLAHDDTGRVTDPAGKG